MRLRDRNRGRRLLALRNLIDLEEDAAARMKLRKEEALLLFELGNPSEAEAAADRLLSDYPDWPAGHAAAADIACRTRRWAEAEALFSRAAQLHADSGAEEAAARMRTGPLYRLAEAREDFPRCLALCEGGGGLARILAIRASRHLGRDAGSPVECAEPLVRHLRLLELAWTGIGVDRLLPEIREWGSSEPEWRWRFLVEGLDLHRSAGGAASDWREVLAETGGPVLDPRYGRERHRLASLDGLC